MTQTSRIKTHGACILVAGALFGGHAVGCSSDSASLSRSSTSPGMTLTGAWTQFADVEGAGWSASKLQAARRYATQIGSAAVMVVARGHVVAAWGHIDHPYKSASIRKSLYDGAIGATHFARPFKLDASLRDLEIDDLQALSDAEKRATLEHMMTARSGVYHPAAYETRSNAMRRPERHSAEPGARWYYNNWDFNGLCVAFERLTDTTIEDAFASRLAGPLGMEDFAPDHVFRWLEPRLSRHPAITFRLSARDLARFGTLYLNGGAWGTTRLIASEWIKRSTTPLTVFEEGNYRGAGNGYGRLWWSFPARADRDSPYQAHQRIAARGAGGQIMALFPDLDLLVVHLADTDRGRGVSDEDGVKLMDMILSARRDRGEPKPKLGPLSPEPLSNTEPRPLRSDYAAIPNDRLAALEGRYSFDRGGVRLYQHDGRLFVQPLGMPLNDAEVLQVPDGSLRSPLVDLVLEPRGSEGSVESLRMTFRGRTVTGRRQED